MATYNGAAHLPVQLAGIANQTFQPAELVIGDDGSTDETLAIVESFAARSRFPVRVTRNPRRLGITENFLATASRCSAPLVAFADQDNVWHPARLASVRVAFQRPDVQLAFHRANIIDDQGRPTGRTFPDIANDRIAEPLELDPWFASHGFLLVTRSSIIQAARDLTRPPSRDLDGHPLDFDEWIFFVGSAVGQTALTRKILAGFRLHPGNFHGPPVGGLVSGVLDRLTGGHERYWAVADMFRAWAAFWDEPATVAAFGSAVSQRAAVHYARLARSSEAGAVATDPDKSWFRGLRSVAALAARGGYRARVRGGLGARALPRDIAGLMVAGRRSAADVSTETVTHMLAAREGGATYQAIADELNEAGVASPIGIGGWRPSIVQHVLHRRRLQDHEAAIGRPPPLGD